MLNDYLALTEEPKPSGRTQNKSSMFAPTIVSIVAILAWLVFILLFALYWSNGYSLFQDIVILIASLGITGLLIGLMWVIWGRNQINWWTRDW